MEKDEKKELFSVDEVPHEIHGVKLSDHSRKMLSEGKMSDMIESMQMEDDVVKSGKIRLKRNEDGSINVLYQFKNEKLVIPETLGDYKLTQDDKQRLNNGELCGPINFKGSDIYLQIDPELNSVVVKAGHECKVSEVIQAKFEKNGEFAIDGYKLSTNEINNLVSGKELEPKVFYNENTKQYFTASISITSDDNGIVFRNFKTLDKKRAVDLMKSLNVDKTMATDNGLNSMMDSSSKILEETKSKDKEVENPIKLNSLVDSSSNIISDGNKIKAEEKVAQPSLNNQQPLANDEIKLLNNVVTAADPQYLIDKHFSINNSLSNGLRLTDFLEKHNMEEAYFASKNANEKAFHQNTLAEKEPYYKEKQNASIILSEKANIALGNGLTTEVKDLFNTQTQEFYNAAEKKDFVKLNNLAYDGYKPSHNEISHIDTHFNLNANEKTAVNTIFGLKSTIEKDGNLIPGDVKDPDFISMDKNQKLADLDSKELDKITSPQEEREMILKEFRSQINEAISQRDFNRISELANEGTGFGRPTGELRQEEVDRAISNAKDLSNEDKEKIHSIFGTKNTESLENVQGLNSLASSASDIMDTTDPKTKEFYNAVENKDFKKLNQLSNEGYKPSEKEISHIDNHSKLSPDEKSAVKTILNIQPDREVGQPGDKSQSVGPKKQKQNEIQAEDKKPNNGHKTKDVMNKAFSNM